MLEKIQPDRLLTDREAREVKAALSLAGHTQRSFAEARGLHYATLIKIVGRKHVPGDRYARVLSRLLRRAEWPQMSEAESRS